MNEKQTNYFILYVNGNSSEYDNNWCTIIQWCKCNPCNRPANHVQMNILINWIDENTFERKNDVGMYTA